MGDVAFALLCQANQLALAIQIGGAIFLLIGGAREDRARGWVERLEGILPVLWLIYMGAAVFAIAVRAAQVADESALISLSEVGWLEAYAFGTHVGRVAIAKIAVAAVLGVLLSIFPRRRACPSCRRLRLIGLSISAGIIIAIGPLAGHAAADDTTMWLVPIHMVHLLATSIWLGGLPFWIAYVVDASRELDNETLGQLHVKLKAFSRLAISCVAILIGSGIVLASGYVETAGDLFGTRYGTLLCGKIALLAGVLLIANRMRVQFLPILAVAETPARLSLMSAARWVVVELMLAATIVCLAVVMAQTTPATHDQPRWLLGRRLSLAATWQSPDTQSAVTIALLITAFLATWLLVARGRLTPVVKVAIVTLILVGAGTALWKLSVPAYPATYRRSTASYLTISIANGMQKFKERCVDCHGLGGLGDGSMVGRLPKRPANLSEPHTALHTAGDIYWWIDHGIPESGMPGFSDKLDEQSSWDIVNFLRTFSEGFQARTLDVSILPGGPWLGAPNFYFDDADGETRELREYRGYSNVLVVFPPKGNSGISRSEQISRWSDALRHERTQILLIGDEVPDQNGLVVIRNGAGEIRQAYDLLSRTIVNRGDGRQLGMNRDHMEFLIDRFGYVRARWIPDESTADWKQLGSLLKEIKLLNEEPRIRPPPEEHVH